jgi:hypothetical protein
MNQTRWNFLRAFLLYVVITVGITQGKEIFYDLTISVLFYLICIFDNDMSKLKKKVDEQENQINNLRQKIN